MDSSASNNIFTNYIYRINSKDQTHNCTSNSNHFPVFNMMICRHTSVCASSQNMHIAFDFSNSFLVHLGEVKRDTQVINHKIASLILFHHIFFLCLCSVPLSVWDETATESQWIHQKIRGNQTKSILPLTTVWKSGYSGSDQTSAAQNSVDAVKKQCHR